MDRLETRELVYFIAVAEELHFGRAAHRLGIAAPPLSRAISLLERRIGAQLFERTSRRVVLTKAGTVFLTEARAAVDAVDAAARLARRAARKDRLVLAAHSGTGTELLTTMLANYRQISQTDQIDVMFTRNAIAALRNGSADIALICGNEDATGLTTEPVARINPVALVPTGHHLAGRREIRRTDLDLEPTFCSVPPPVPIEELIDRVAVGQLIVIIGGNVAGRLDATVTAVPIVDLPDTLLRLAWRRNEMSLLARRMTYASKELVVSVGHEQLVP